MEEFKDLVDLRFAPDQEDNSSDLYPVILKSQSITQGVLKTTYEFTHNDKPLILSLSDYFGEKDVDDLHRRLNEVFSVSVGKSTGVIELSLETRYPGLSQAVLAEYLRQLEYYNIHRRSSQAKSYADYLAREMVIAQAELDSAEERLSQFQSSNRNWGSTTDPVLSRDLARLERDVSMESATFTFLRRELEMARLNVQKDVPVVRILDSPGLPTRKSSPNRTLIVLLGTIMIACLVVIGVLSWELFRHSSMNDHRVSYEDLRADVESAFPRSLKFIRRLTERTRVPQSRND